MTDRVDTYDVSDRCPCGDPILHPPEAHTSLVVAIATAEWAARIARETATTATAWMQVVRRLAGDESR